MMGLRLQVQQLQVAAVLQGAHKDAAVTAVKWCPESHSRDLKSHNHLRCAGQGRPSVQSLSGLLARTARSCPYCAPQGMSSKFGA